MKSQNIQPFGLLNRSATKGEITTVQHHTLNVQTEIDQRTTTLEAPSGSIQPMKHALTLTSIFPLSEKRPRIEVSEQHIFFPMEVQTELTVGDINNLFKYCQELSEDRNKLLLQISTLKLDYEYFQGNDKKNFILYWSADMEVAQPFLQTD